MLNHFYVEQSLVSQEKSKIVLQQKHTNHQNQLRIIRIVHYSVEHTHLHQHSHAREIIKLDVETIFCPSELKLSWSKVNQNIILESKIMIKMNFNHHSVHSGSLGTYLRKQSQG